MTRPFYVHTPRNYLGESLVGPDIQQMSHSIRNVFDNPIKQYVMDKDLNVLESKCKEMNDRYEGEMMAIEI